MVGTADLLKTLSLGKLFRYIFLIDVTVNNYNLPRSLKSGVHSGPTHGGAAAITCLQWHDKVSPALPMADFCSAPNTHAPAQSYSATARPNMRYVLCWCGQLDFNGRFDFMSFCLVGKYRVSKKCTTCKINISQELEGLLKIFYYLGKASSMEALLIYNFVLLEN